MRIDKQKLVYTLIFILLLSAGMVYKFLIKNNRSGIVLETEEILSSISSMTEISAASRQIKIYICGEVVNPGIYEVEQGTILNDVVLLAGGFTEDAALDHLDLVYVFNDNMSVYIPSEETLSEGDSVILRNVSASGGTEEQTLVNINTATKEELITLPGVGESTARAIIDYRQDHLFERPEDLMNVSGIGEAKYARLRDHIRV
ncbi:MAG: helix-hairpin-helix domain-containing protein [Clostridiales bacterium]|nr:helix-hairpin-helix domain-containing protein [Clostridiales bacterium]